MESGAEKSYVVRTPEEYAKIFDRLRIPGEKKPIQDNDHLSNKAGLATYAALNIEKGIDTVSDHQDILLAEEALENRYKIRGDVRSSMRPTFHSIKTVGKEVNQKLSEIVDLRKRIIEEVAQHALTLDKKRDLHRQLLDAETFITQKNAQILLLQQQIKNTTTGNAEASAMLDQGRSDMTKELEKTVLQVSEISKITKDAEEKVKQDIAELKVAPEQPSQKEGDNKIYNEFRRLSSLPTKQNTYSFKSGDKEYQVDNLEDFCMFVKSQDGRMLKEGFDPSTITDQNKRYAFDSNLRRAVKLEKIRTGGLYSEGTTMNQKELDDLLKYSFVKYIEDLRSTLSDKERMPNTVSDKILSVAQKQKMYDFEITPKPATNNTTTSIDTSTDALQTKQLTEKTEPVEIEQPKKPEEEKLPESKISTTPEKKKVGTISPEDASKMMEGVIETLKKYRQSSALRRSAEDLVKMITKTLVNGCDDEETVKRLIADMEATLNPSTKVEVDTTTPEPKRTRKPAAKKERRGDEAKVKNKNEAEQEKAEAAHAQQTEKRVNIAKGALVATSAALAGFGLAASQAPEKFDLATRQALTQKIEAPAENQNTIEKIGNIEIDSRAKMITVGGVNLLVTGIEKKGDYYICSQDFGGKIKYIAIPSVDVLKTLAIAKNDEEVKVLLSPFANMVLIENPIMPGISIVTGRTEDGKVIMSYSFKRQEREVVEARDKHIEVKESPVVKEIFGKKYNEYVRSLQNLTLDQFKSLSHDEIGGIEKEVRVLGERLLFYKYNEAAKNKKIGDLLNELPK